VTGDRSVSLTDEPLSTASQRCVPKHTPGQVRVRAFNPLPSLGPASLLVHAGEALGEPRRVFGVGSSPVGQCPPRPESEARPTRMSARSDHFLIL